MITLTWRGDFLWKRFSSEESGLFRVVFCQVIMPFALTSVSAHSSVNSSKHFPSSYVIAANLPCFSRCSWYNLCRPRIWLISGRFYKTVISEEEWNFLPPSFQKWKNPYWKRSTVRLTVKESEKSDAKQVSNIDLTPCSQIGGDVLWCSAELRSHYSRTYGWRSQRRWRPLNQSREACVKAKREQPDVKL